MENNKNNALEKVEAVITEKQRSKAEIKAHKKDERQKEKLARRRDRDRKRQTAREEQMRQKQGGYMQEGEQNQNGKMSKKGYIATIISLGVATLVLSSVLTYSYLVPSANDVALDAGYNKVFYDTAYQVENIDVNLSKALSTKDSGALQKYLVDTAIESELAESDLQSLPLQDESKYYTTKLINQIGDYAKYLNNKLIDGEPLSSKDYEGLRQLYSANVTLKKSLQKMIEDMGDNYSFKEMAGGGKDMIVEGFDELQNLSSEYPELIYDGPFSDGSTEREIKGLKGEEIGKDKAKEIFNSVFKKYHLTDVQHVGETLDDIRCFNVQGKDENGDLLYAEISKIGGKLIMFAYAGNCNDVNFDKDYAENIAFEFLKGLNIHDMKAVWCNLDNNVYTFNFAYEKNGIICYADLITVRVCADSGRVLGIEASSYYTNHTERSLPSAVLSTDKAKEKVADNIAVETARVVVVPIGAKSEKLCYEFMGKSEGATYYVYIDALSGKQVEMFKVVETTEGELLM